MLAVYKSLDEILVFEVDSSGAHVEKEQYFNPEGGSIDNIDDYNVEVVEPPLKIRAGLVCEEEGPRYDKVEMAELLDENKRLADTIAQLQRKLK